MFKEKIKNIKENMTPTKTLVASLTLVIVISIIGVSWAWFSAMTEDGDLQGVIVETANLSIVYNSGPEYEENNILPGWSGSKTFTVTNNGDREATYSIVWENVLNTFNNKQDVVYSVTSTNGGGTLAETQFPNTGTNVGIISNVTIPADTTQTYTITFRYINRTSIQNDQGSLIRGKIIINEEATTPNNDDSDFVYVVNNTRMNTGSEVPSEVNQRTSLAAAIADWAEITGDENDTKPFYLKHKLNGSNEIEESYTCFERNNTQYCLKGDDENAFSDNAKIIYDAFEGAGCTGDSNLPENYNSNYRPTPDSHFYCYVSNLEASTSSNGEVLTTNGLKGDMACVVENEGVSYCDERIR